MALTKAEKKETLDKLSVIFKEAKAITFATYDGLTVAEVSDMRRNLKKVGVGYRVVKKTLARKALESGKFEGTIPPIAGQLGLAYSVDLIAPAREIFQAGKKYEGKIAIAGGIFDGRYMSKDEMVAIASIPSREVLLGMFLNVINSPIQGLVIALDAISKKKVS